MTFVLVKECEDSDECVKLPLKHNRLTLITLKETFSGSAGLLYRSGTELNAVGLLSGDDTLTEPFFEEPESGWANKTFFMKRGSRPPTPIENDVNMTTPPPSISRVAIHVLNECSDRVYRVHGEISSIVMTTNNQQKNSVSQQIGSGVQFQEKHILTAAHLKFVVGNEYDLWKNGKTLKATCIYINKSFDFAILESDSLPKTSFSTGFLNRGDKFVILGFPENSNHDNPSVSDGTIEGLYEDGIHFLGAIGSRHGFSGAPVFDKLSYLTGIVIGGKNGVSLEMTVRDFAKQLVNDSGTQPCVKILPLSVIRAQVSTESSKDSL